MNPITIDQSQISVVKNIRGIDIYSPVTLYQSQESFVAYIIDCLNNGENPLVQSPTGTGKTLSLLCSTLSWVYNEQNKNKNNYRIIYTSRTHSQLNQVIQELKRLAFKVKISQLASRDHTCINDQLNLLSGHSKQLQCRLRTMKKGGPFCKYFHHEDYYEKLPLNGNINDLEQIIDRGKHETFCPYFYQKSCKNSANLILMPYNYLLDQKLMGNQLSEILKSAIIIFDEGHNIPSVCQQSQQFKINLQTMERALNHLSQLRQLCLKTIQSNNQQVKFKSIPSQFQLHADYVTCLHSHFQTLNLPPEQSGIILNAHDFMQILKKGTIDSDQGQISNNILKLHTSSINIRSDIIFRPYWALQSWLSFVNFLKEIYQDGKAKKSQNQQQQFYSKAYQFQISYQGSDIKICLICLDPKICFKKLQKYQPKSLIITSGTLSPLNSWPLQLQTNFAKALALPHILSKQQVNGCIITCGPNKSKINFSYSNRENKDLYAELGQILLDIADNTNGGMVILFPSYFVLEKVKNQLSSNGYLSKIYQKKTIFIETKNSSDFKSTLNSYFQHCKNPKGAAFLALARGKISEGLDLSDQKCRALVMVGVPYPASQDIKVKAKMAYLDQKNNIKKTISGNQWYICQTIRCINQSIGRIIRHKNDYGSIYFIDQRFKKSQIMSQLSNWAKQCTKVYNDYQQVLFKMAVFKKAISSKQSQDKQAQIYFKSVKGAQLGKNTQYSKTNKTLFPRPFDLSFHPQKQSMKSKNINPQKQRSKVQQLLKDDIQKIQKAEKKQQKWNKQRMIFKGSFNKKLPTKQTHVQNKECPICRYERKLIKNSECPHELCSDCWDIWLKKDLRCPVCRVRVREKYLIK